MGSCRWGNPRERDRVELRLGLVGENLHLIRDGWGPGVLVDSEMQVRVMTGRGRGLIRRGVN